MGISYITPSTVFVVWAVVTSILVLTLIYRRTLTTREEDQIFLDPAEHSLVDEQHEIVARLRRLSRPIIGLSILSVALFVATVGLWLWQGWKL